MSDHFQTDPFDDLPPQILRLSAEFPAWLARRLLRPGEEITLVRGPQLNPPWERYATHPLLFLVALTMGTVCVTAGRLLAGSWSDMSPLPFMAAIGLVFGSVFVLGFSSGYFTRLVVTNYRIVLLQGYEMCRSWDIDDLPPSLIRYGLPGAEEGSRTVDLDALQTMLGSTSEHFSEQKRIRAFGKHLDGIISREKHRPGPGRQPLGD
jgi:hypothetical protein